MTTSKKPPRYKLVTDGVDTYRGLPITVGCDHTWGSGRPLVAAVLKAVEYCADPDACNCGSNCGSKCTCPKVKRWVVARTSYTRLVAATFCDKLRGQGRTAILVGMEPAS